mmetsp:Transcript_28908/g.72551  ORF Transcript_28908/g.72551 Transcript_28908/m.72551 type:complete len:365 (+) Transcript_28908:2102-3196(+)
MAEKVPVDLALIYERLQSQTNLLLGLVPMRQIDGAVPTCVRRMKLLAMTRGIKHMINDTGGVGPPLKLGSLKHGDCDILRNVLGAIRGLNLLHEGLHLQWVCCPRHNVHVPRDVTSLELLALHPEGPFVSLWVVPVCNNAISHAPLQARPPAVHLVDKFCFQLGFDLFDRVLHAQRGVQDDQQIDLCIRTQVLLLHNAGPFASLFLVHDRRLNRIVAALDVHCGGWRHSMGHRPQVWKLGPSVMPNECIPVSSPMYPGRVTQLFRQLWLWHLHAGQNHNLHAKRVCFLKHVYEALVSRNQHQHRWSARVKMRRILQRFQPVHNILLDEGVRLVTGSIVQAILPPGHLLVDKRAGALKRNHLRLC